MPREGCCQPKISLLTTDSLHGGWSRGPPTPHQCSSCLDSATGSRAGSLLLVCFNILALGSLVGEGLHLTTSCTCQQAADGEGITSSLDKGP